MRRNLIVMVSGEWRKTWSEYTCTASQVRQLPGQHGRVSPLWHGQTHSGWHRGLHWGCGRGVPREQLRGWPRQAVWLPAAWEPDHEDGGLCVPGNSDPPPRPGFPSTCGTSCLSLTCLIVQDVPTMEACRDLCLTAPYRWVSSILVSTCVVYIEEISKHRLWYIYSCGYHGELEYAKIYHDPGGLGRQGRWYIVNVGQPTRSKVNILRLGGGGCGGGAPSPRTHAAFYH